MPGIQIAEARAPWVMFETRPVEDRKASIETGMYRTKDVDFALITPHGSRDQIDREVSEWFTHLAAEVKSERFPASWLDAYKAAYKRWKDGQAQPVDGTSVANWPVASPSQVKLLQDLHILTVEVLAGANEETIRRIGMGGVSLVQKAKEWVEQGKRGVNVEQTVALQQELADQKAIVAKQQEQIDALIARLGDGGTVTNQLQAGTGIGAADLLETNQVPTATAPKKL